MIPSTIGYPNMDIQNIW